MKNQFKYLRLIDVPEGNSIVISFDGSTYAFLIEHNTSSIKLSQKLREMGNYIEKRELELYNDVREQKDSLE